MGYRLVALPDGMVEVHVSGPSDAPGLLVFHVGTPAAAVGFPGLTAAAAQHGLRTLIYSRPGYGRSSRMEGRTVADEAARTAALVDHLGYADFYVVGWSGGGLAALACAALLPDRVRACLTLASPAPIREAGDGWQAWHSEADARELEVLATPDRASLVSDYAAGAQGMARMTPARLGSFPGGRSVAEDRALFGETGLAVPMARSLRRAVLNGPWGWFDDAVAQASVWGFRVADIRVPIVVRQGEDDRFVDPLAGRWLASTIPGAIARILPGQGHGSILDPYSEFLGELVEAGDRARRPVTRSG
jgi:pimeloyl-ACP methyl ester carboxylesterase